MPERLPPHSIETEEALLGALLLSRDAVGTAVLLVTVKDFYRPSHGELFATIAKLHGSGEPTDPASVAAALPKRILEDLGGSAALMSLQSRTPSTSSAARYARVIAGHAAMRNLIDVGGRVANLGYEATDPADAVEQARTWLAEVDLPVASLPGDLWEVGEFLDQPEDRWPWAVPGLLRQHDRCVIVAPEGRGKTMLLRSMAMTIGQGLHPFTFAPIPPQRTLLVDAENPRYLIAKKMRPMRSNMFQSNRTWLWSRPGGVNLLKRAPFAELEAVVAYVKPAVVCLGPLYKLLVGDKKDEEVMGALLARLDDLRARYGLVLVLEHHAPKEQQGVRKMQPYGSQTLLAWPEFGIGLQPIPPSRDTPSGALAVEFWRGSRDERPWPAELHRGTVGPWPWAGKYLTEQAA